MEDIICTIPLQCGEKDCAAQWHLRYFWAYDDGTFSECDADGNHNDIDADDIPSADAETQAWREYAAWVAETGVDPLREYAVARTIKRHEVWRIRVRPSVLGAVVYQVMRNRKRYDPRELPAHVAQYLTIDAQKRNGAMIAFPDYEDFRARFPKYRLGRWMRIDIKHDVPRSASVVTRELKRAARRTLREQA